MNQSTEDSEFALDSSRTNRPNNPMNQPHRKSPKYTLIRLTIVFFAIISTTIWIICTRSEDKQFGGVKNVAKGTVRKFEYFHKNEEGKGIQQVLYDEETVKERKKFHERRIAFMSAIKDNQSLYLSIFNLKTDHSRDQQQQILETQQYERINKIWNFEAYPKQLPICLIIPSYNNNAKFRIQYNLNSIFQQNYSNYYVVIINDASTDGSDQLYKKYLNFYNIDKSIYSFVNNTQRLFTLENYYNAVHDYCSSDSIVIGVDGDDELIGKNVLKIFNVAYQKFKAGVVWSSFYWYNQGKTSTAGTTSEYQKTQKQANSYRYVLQRFSQLRSFRSQLFLHIDKTTYFTYQNGSFYRSASDMAMMFPLLQLSCGRNTHIEGYHYLYNINTGLNDFQVGKYEQELIDRTSRGKPRLECWREFEEKMKNWRV